MMLLLLKICPSLFSLFLDQRLRSGLSMDKIGSKELCC